MGKDEEEKEKFAFFSSWSDASTTAAEREVETAAAGGPGRTGYGYGDVATDGATMEEGLPADAHASAVQAAEEWAAMVEDTAWPTEAPEVAALNNTRGPAKDNAEEEAADGTAGGDGLFDALTAAADEGGGVSGS